jgi:hypothetical protein
MASSWRAFSDLRDPRGSGTARYIRIKTCHVHGYRANANFNAMGSSLLWLLTIVCTPYTICQLNPLILHTSVQRFCPADLEHAVQP